MWVKTYSKVYQGVKKEDIWRLWADVNQWPAWDKELKYCEMQGEFKMDNQFILKPKSGPKVKITLSDVQVNKQFTDFCDFLGARMFDEHQLEDTAEGLRISSKITVTGPLSFIWANLVAKNVANSVPKQMDALVELAKTP